jgi:hypothetical protein
MYIGKFLKRREGILKPNPILSKMNQQVSERKFMFYFYRISFVGGELIRAQTSD